MAPSVFETGLVRRVVRMLLMPASFGDEELSVAGAIECAHDVTLLVDAAYAGTESESEIFDTDDVVVIFWDKIPS